MTDPRNAIIKQLRKDARNLTTVAKHLRSQANELAREIKAEEKAARIRANFFSKPAEIDGKTPLVPEVPEELFPERAEHAARAREFRKILEPDFTPK